MSRDHNNENFAVALGVDETKLEPYFHKVMENQRVSQILEAIEQFELPVADKLVLTFRVAQFVTEVMREVQSQEPPPESEA